MLLSKIVLKKSENERIKKNNNHEGDNCLLFLIGRGKIMDFTVTEAAKTKLDAMLQERGLTDVFFVMDYVDGDSPFL